ncbi:MAG: sigma 54-interacting transcriptional regulator [Polyangiaceae bacterium]
MNEEVTWSRVLPQAAAGEERLVLLWDNGSLTRPLSQGDDLVIGRSRSADVSVDHKSVSREHARVRLTGSGVEIVDLGSSNGTRVSGASLTPNQAIRVPLGALVQLGSVVLVVEQAPTPTQAPESRPLGQRMQELGQLIASVAASDISVVLCGETGVGKDVMASQIHGRSRRARHPLVRLNCAALAETLLESELFGHERGAFTGAVQSKQGLLEGANGGSIFFDEVGEMPLGVQAKLLRAIEQREVYRVGGVRPVSFDVRFIAATNRELDKEILEGRFRRDLYFRLAGITLQIPPLRERLDELPSLVQTFVTEHAARSGIAPPAVSASALQRLLSHSWPGNLRELKNVVERAVVLSGGRAIEAHHVHIDPVAAALGNSEARPQAVTRLSDTRSRPSDPDAADAWERERIQTALEQARGNQTRAAELLGVSRRTLINRLERFKLPRPRKR